MIQPVIEFTTEFLKDKHFVKVLEVGSRSVAGTIKPTFEDKCDEYIGLDLIAGANVDIIADAEDLPDYFLNETFDCVVCVETLEHTKNPIKIVENMRNVLKSGGWMLITTPCTGHPYHGWPDDYYRFFESVYRDVFFKDFVNCHFETKTWLGNNPAFPDAVLGYGRKP